MVATSIKRDRGRKRKTRGHLMGMLGRWSGHWKIRFLASRAVKGWTLGGGAKGRRRKKPSPETKRQSQID